MQPCQTRRTGNTGRRIQRTGAAALLPVLAIGLLMLPGCQTDNMPRQRSAEIERNAAEADLPAVSLDDVVPLEIVHTASAEMGGPKRYLLRVARGPAQLPGVVKQQGLEVDFEQHSVILLGMGQQSTSGYSAAITGAQRVGDTVYVQAEFTRPGDDETVAQVVTAPWAAAAVEKLGPEVTLRSDFD